MDILVWEDKYYNEMDTDTRIALLKKQIVEEGMTESLQIAKQFSDARFTPVGKELKTVDHMIRGLERVKLGRYFRNPESKGAVKQKEAIFSDLGKAIADANGELGRELWYKELKHMGKAFIQLNLGDGYYCSYLWGIGHMNKTSICAKIASDLYNVGFEMPQIIGLAEDLSVYTEALKDAFFETFPAQKEYLMAKMEGRKIKGV